MPRAQCCRYQSIKNYTIGRSFYGGFLQQIRKSMLIMNRYCCAFKRADNGCFIFAAYATNKDDSGFCCNLASKWNEHNAGCHDMKLVRQFFVIQPYNAFGPQYFNKGAFKDVPEFLSVKAA